MEGVEVEDVSPALEATEDFLESSQGDGQLQPCRLEEVSVLCKLSGMWNLLAGQHQEDSKSWAWTEQTTTHSILGYRHGKRCRAHSTNDLAVHSSTLNNGSFKRGHNRSHSDMNYSTCTDNGLPVLDRNMLKTLAFRTRGEANPEWDSSLVKQGALEQREGTRGRWTSCHVELTNCELRLYSLDSSGNRQLCTALSLSHCQAVGPLQGQDGHVLEALFFNSTLLQLRASCQWEAQEWSRLLWACVIATRPHKDPTYSSRTAFEASASTTLLAQLTPTKRPTTLPLFIEQCTSVLKVGQLKQLCDLNNWRAFNFVLTHTHLQAFPTEDKCCLSEPLLQYHLASCLAVQHDASEESGCLRFQAVFANEVLCMQAANEPKAQSWVEALRSAVAAQRGRGSLGEDSKPGLSTLTKTQERLHGQVQKDNHQSVTTSFLSILTCLAVEKGLTAQNFRCAGCQRPVGLSQDKAKVCYYSGRYYCQNCHQDNLFIIPARLLHNWDTNRYKVSKQAKEFLEFVYEEPLLDIQQLNPCLYRHCELLATVLTLRQRLQSLRAYLFSCRAAIAEDLRRRIFPREYLLQHIHLYSMADLQQVIDGKLAPFLSKVIKFATSHVYSCSLCSEKGFICELCQNSQVIYPFQESASKRCEGCGAVFHAECCLRGQSCPRCVQRELHKKPASFWRRLDTDDSPNNSVLGYFELGS
ncbi:pleckstrin homology domain-containing family M member 3 isoform X1 [Alosa sapidissima]|uniref:pleckstrin homology domain-containing family M member 3 isoform X1 n=1 Tax=Alosa sapidissima TaxID=34773 RepID=UPI001C09BB81|nr:pleckstrin homology domain-containing family M member 3 isoform X1 [Alosa sapidissima]